MSGPSPVLVHQWRHSAQAGVEEAKECDQWHLRIAVPMVSTAGWPMLPAGSIGWVLGKRIVQITHRGRKSGVLRRTVLEVLHYDPQTREVLVVSGWEGKTDWYRNIECEPALEVRIGRVHYRPVQEFLSPRRNGPADPHPISPASA